MKADRLQSPQISSILAGIAASIAAEYGLGKSPDQISNAQFESTQKAIYVTEIFHVLTLGLGKLSFVALFYVLLSSTHWSRAVIAAAGFLLLWTVTMIVAVSLECHPPEVWNIAEGTCHDLVSSSDWLPMIKHCLLIQI